MKTKKIRRRKFNFLKFLKFILFLFLTIYIVIYISKVPIKTILIKGTNYITDEEIIETAKLENYPSYIKTLNSKIEKRIEKLPLVKEVEVKKKFWYKLEINITEHKILFQIRSTGEYILDNDTKLNELNINTNIPVLINYVPDETLEKMIKKFLELDTNVLSKISEIEFTPTNYDDERFLFYMNDGNEVYITLNKTKEFNKYNTIKKQLGNNKGILYLDSGNYFEIKE